MIRMMMAHASPIGDNTEVQETDIMPVMPLLESLAKSSHFPETRSYMANLRPAHQSFSPSPSQVQILDTGDSTRVSL